MINLEVQDKKTRLTIKDGNLHEAIYGINTLMGAIKDNQKKMSDEDIFKLVKLCELEGDKKDGQK